MTPKLFVEAIIKFIKLPYDKKNEMGIAGRRKMENEFDRNTVINTYLQEINLITNRGNINESIREVS